MRHVLVFPDIHFRKKAGGEDRRTLAAVKHYAADNTWDEVVFLGDVMEHSSISRHNERNLRAVSGETLLRDYEHANKALDEIDQATPGAKKVIIEGNHDWRPEAVVNFQPQLQGLVETKNGLRLDERGWEWVPYWSEGTVYRVGKAGLIHGRYVCDHHAKMHVSRYGMSVFYGHVHDVQAYSLVHEGNDSTLVGQSLGCLCDYDQTYLQGNPTRWQQAIGEFWVSRNGNFNYNVHRIFDHRFVVNGKVYKP